jgi:DNA-binding GntR family transcriptional regulator
LTCPYGLSIILYAVDCRQSTDDCDYRHIKSRVKQMTQLPAQLNHIENKSRREQIIDILREAIVSGELKPGQSLIETEIAAQLGVSRAPLREAFQALSHEGLVETLPYRGTIVRKLELADIEELYSFRSLLEEFALRRVIERRNPDDVDLLRQHFRNMLEAAERDDVRQVNMIDREFHDALIELSGHRLLQASWQTVSLRVRQVMSLRNRQNRDLTRVAYNHVPIIDAIARWEGDEAARLLREHIASAGDLLAEMWDDALDGQGAEA